MTALPSFEAFFSDLHQRAPFPWQRRLAVEVVERGWPEVLDLPTGVGKTSALDIALYCLAVAPARMPRRVVLVVDRRIVVDQGAAHAREVRDALWHATSGPLAVVADHLRVVIRSNTCTGTPEFRGDRDNDPTNNSDCPSNASNYY